jgi:hypothetical protein
MLNIKKKLLTGILLFTSSYSFALSIDSAKNEIKKNANTTWKYNIDQINNYIQNEKDSETLKIWDYLNKLYEKDAEKEIIDLFFNVKSGEEAAAIRDWLRWIILTKNADGRYAYLYSYILDYEERRKRKKEKHSIVFYTLAHLSTEMDSLYCADKSARRVITNKYEKEPHMQALNEQKSKYSKNEMLNYAFNALSIEELRGARKPLAVYCQYSNNSILQAIKLGRTPKIETIQDGPMKGITIANDFSIDTSDIPQEYISKEDFLQEREKYIDSVISAFAD